MPTNRTYLYSRPPTAGTVTAEQSAAMLKALKRIVKANQWTKGSIHWQNMGLDKVVKLIAAVTLG